MFKKAHINLRINVLTTNCRTSADGLRMSVPQMVKQVRVQLIVKFVRRITTEGNTFCFSFATDFMSGPLFEFGPGAKVLTLRM